MSTPTPTTTREAWLMAAVDALRPRFAEVGMPLPERVRISVGFGYGSKRESAVILGQCWARRAVADDTNTIFISPEVEDTAQVLGILVHELIHAADDCEHGHKGAFAEAATRLGLEGPMTATVPGMALACDLLTLAATMGDYSHAALKVSQPAKVPVGPDGQPIPDIRIHSGPKTQGTRMLKVQCPCCGYTVRTTAKWLAVGNPSCPLGTEMLPVSS